MGVGTDITKSITVFIGYLSKILKAFIQNYKHDLDSPSHLKAFIRNFYPSSLSPDSNVVHLAFIKNFKVTLNLNFYFSYPLFRT